MSIQITSTWPEPGANPMPGRGPIRNPSKHSEHPQRRYRWCCEHRRISSSRSVRPGHSRAFLVAHSKAPRQSHSRMGLPRIRGLRPGGNFERRTVNEGIKVYLPMKRLVSVSPRRLKPALSDARQLLTKGAKELVQLLHLQMLSMVDAGPTMIWGNMSADCPIATLPSPQILGAISHTILSAIHSSG